MNGMRKEGLKNRCAYVIVVFGLFLVVRSCPLSQWRSGKQVPIPNGREVHIDIVKIKLQKSS